ncbi:pyruvate kinase [Allorhizobium sp. BGMRC 0089]|uniref:pyruvate kinase n=1 Tax=Allorhizobium sonneratiae TaxID=2934936 RepID=UPI002033B05D|nr:pyruvate kinase [Allorhizobium sonneratiae]MCM2291483.1 pyruvate kinase [Allorhizobium sonneratiae]
MDTLSLAYDHDRAAQLLEELLALKAAVVADASETAFLANGPQDDPGLANLACYLALRRRDLRLLQRRLMALGLSSLGRAESRVLPTLDAVIAALAAMSGEVSPVPTPSSARFFAGEERLADAALALFGPATLTRHTRIMVTLPGEAAIGSGLILDLARQGMDIARINCAHDRPEVWRALAAEVRSAGHSVGRDLKVLMDIAGPKIRTEAVLPEKKAVLHCGDRIRLVATGAPRIDADACFSAAVSLPDIVTRLKAGDRLRYDDGKLEAVVETAGGGEALLRVVRVRQGGVKLKPEKGINLPDTGLGLSPLTVKDEEDLATVVDCADMIGYSFVSRPEDIDLLDAALARLGRGDKTLGLIAKVEQPEALDNLPALIARAKRRGSFGVMIARGDLAAEIGFERLAEMQEEILWICEAAGIPSIWATQVLEDMVKDGIPSRGEMTDAAMAARAECVMLNKGPAIVEAVTMLASLLNRMDQHVFKKTPTLRALKSW